MPKMNLKNLTVLLLAVSLVSSFVLTGGCASARVAQSITPQKALTLIQENRDNPDFAIIDVRTAPEFAGGYIDNAANIDFYAETFRDELDRLDKNKTYLIYCRSGSRSGKALGIMAELGFQEVYDVDGGILAWNGEGLPTVK